MKKFIALLSVCVVTLGVLVNASAADVKKRPRSSACSPIIVEYYIDKDGFKMPRITYDEECRRLQKWDGTKRAEPLEVYPAGPFYPDGSFSVKHEIFGTTTYVPQADGTLKAVP